MSDIVLLHNWQSLSGRSCVMRNDEIIVLSECCSADIVSDRGDWCKCCCCDTRICPNAFSTRFRIDALKINRAHDYWWDWGKYWFGLSEFSIEGDFDG